MKKIVVATTPRTGSSLLVDSLGRHPKAISAGEWFNQDVEEFVRENKRHPESLTRSNLFKVFVNDFDEEVCRDIFNDAYVVFLYREDKKAQINSWRKACETGWFVAECRAEPRPMPKEAHFLIYYAHELFESLADYIISYERMTTCWDEVVSEILTAAEWDVVPIPQARMKLQPFLYE